MVVRFLPPSVKRLLKPTFDIFQFLVNQSKISFTLLNVFFINLNITIDPEMAQVMLVQERNLLSILLGATVYSN